MPELFTFRRLRRGVVVCLAALALAFAGLVAFSGASQAAAQGPCDIYAAAGTPCAVAHSTTRALFASYNGPLYQATGPGSVNAAHAVRTVGHCPTGRTPGVCRRLTLTSTPL